MAGRLKHRAPSSSKSAHSTSSAAVGNIGMGSSNEQTQDKTTRSRTESGERLKMEDRPRIVPVGFGWEVHPYKSRKPATVMGALVREMYPDGINTTDGMKPVLRWFDYKRTRSGGQRNDRRVLDEFWWRFTCLPEHRAQADRVLEKNLQNRVIQMLSEEKKNAVNKLYANGNVPEEDVDNDGNRWPTVEALISAKPKDFTTDEGWRLLCEHWSTPSFRKKSLLGKRNRLAGGEGAVYHRNGSRSLPATRQHLTLKTGVDPGLAGAWLHTHQIQQEGTNDEVLCSESATEKWEQYAAGMELKYGPNWRVEHPELDIAVIYECVGGTPHGRLGIADEAFGITEKEEIKTRKINRHSNVSAREQRLERENEKLKRENNGYRELVRVVRAMAANSGMDYDALVQETAPSLATSESMAGLSRKHDTVNQERTEQDNSTGGDYGHGDYHNYDNGGGNNDYEDGEDYDNGEDYGYENYEDYNNGYADDYEYEDDDDYGRY